MILLIGGTGYVGLKFHEILSQRKLRETLRWCI